MTAHATHADILPYIHAALAEWAREGVRVSWRDRSVKLDRNWPLESSLIEVLTDAVWLLVIGDNPDAEEFVVEGAVLAFVDRQSECVLGIA